MDSCNQKNSRVLQLLCELGGCYPWITRWGLQIVPPNTAGVQRPKLCKGNCGPDGGIQLNFGTNRSGLQWETQVLGHQGPSKLGKVQEEDTERNSPPTFLNLLSQHIPVARLLRSSSGKCNCLLFLNNSRKNSPFWSFLFAGCTPWLANRVLAYTCYPLGQEEGLCILVALNLLIQQFRPVLRLPVSDASQSDWRRARESLLNWLLVLKKGFPRRDATVTPLTSGPGSQCTRG